MRKKINTNLLKAVLKQDGIEVQMEYKFHPDRKWRFDIAIPEHMIAIELEGGVWTRGRHTRGQGYINDCTKYNTATSMGWRVLRYTHSGHGIGDIIDDVKTLISND